MVLRIDAWFVERQQRFNYDELVDVRDQRCPFGHSSGAVCALGARS
jgi:hypothetical protein